MNKISTESADDPAVPVNAVAIIGIGGRLPGADDMVQFWHNIRNGIDSITHFSEAELEDAFPDEVRRSTNFVRARSILKDVDKFDAEFFGMRSREADLTDPQHRLLLECAWRALEDGGYDPARYPGAIGVFAGCSMNTYFLNNVAAQRKTAEEFTSSYQVGSYEMLVGALSDTLATRLAYKLNLRGPAMTVQSACSTSLLAVAQACQSLLLYQADMMLAGGVSITFPQKRGYLHQEGGMVSPDGMCRPFDARAGGTVFGDGAAVVLLKRLEDAVADGDRIYAVIRSSAVNNDGGDKVGFTAPSVKGQADVITAAYAIAGIDARSIGYVECHGTATPLGDPIEFAGLVKAFAESENGVSYCALGSAKANIGHLDVAAGATGLIKAALALHHREIPPLKHFREPNPRIALQGSPFYVPTELTPWPAGTTPRRAGVSAFGVGGTNVHVVLEEAPRVRAATSISPDRLWHVMPMAARNETALSNLRSAIADRLDADETFALADAAFTLQQGRAEFKHRSAIVCRNRREAAQKLRATAIRSATVSPGAAVIFMFPGQGAQYPGMGHKLYQSEPIFRGYIDRGAEILLPLIGKDIRPLMFGDGSPSEDAAKTLSGTQFAQPALFLIEYATAQLWMHWGVKPDAMVGHSIGEFVAACLSGVLTFEDALHLVAKRGQLLQRQPSGAMLAVRVSESEARALLENELDLAAINAPSMCVVAGPLEAINELEQRLAARNIAHRRLHTSHAFHSRMMDQAAKALVDEAASFTFGAPRIPYASCTTGHWATREQAGSPEYWARHCREPVRFADALATVSGGRPAVLIEVGPGSTLNALAAQCLPKDRIAVMATSLGDPSQAADDNELIAEALGRVWCAGVRPNWSQLHNGQQRKRVALPTYPFQRQRHWIDAPAPSRDVTEVTVPSTTTPPVDSSSRSEPSLLSPKEPSMSSASSVRKDTIRTQIIDILESLSGDKLPEHDPGTTFLELGFDSLFLGQVAQQLKTKLGVDVTFRQLLGDVPSIEDLASHVDSMLPKEVAPRDPASKPQVQMTSADPLPRSFVGSAPITSVPMNGDVATIMRMQLEAVQNVIDQQLRALGAVAPIPASDAGAPQAVLPSQPRAQASPAQRSPTESEDRNPRFQMHKPGSRSQTTLTEPQQRLIAELSARALTRTPGSKAYAQRNRSVLADPRTAAGFRLEWKDLVFPVVCERSKGSKIWDIDGNEYVDLVNGYGQTAFGHAPDFVCRAVAEQLEKGFAIGPQSPLAGEVAQMIAEMTGAERVTFCNTGSEAVMAAMRVARAATGRKRIVVFNNDYHGQFDEVLVKGGRQGAPRALPIASGIPIDSVANMVVLPYGTDESLNWIRENAGDLAAVIVEPVQSRHPDFRPVDFMRALRTITESSGAALVFDEVVTGFRVHQGGAQAVFNIRADLATYGKVLGGGMPIGVLAGKSKFMDVLDGGQWRYGDNSTPEVAPTFFAGTFVRHPLTLAAARATLRYMQAEGPGLQDRIADKTAKLVATINSDLARRAISTRAETFSSWFHISFGAEDHLGSLFYPIARSLGLHIQESYPCFLTTEHSDSDIDFIASVFRQSLDTLQSSGILTAKTQLDVPDLVNTPLQLAHTPPLPTDAPLTEPQMEVWLSAQLGDEASASFNESLSIRLEGNLDIAALTSAWIDVITRHEALRLRISPTGERMLVTKSMTLPLPVVDLSDHEHPEAAFKDLLSLDARTAFNLTSGPVARAQLVRLGEQRHVFVFTAHHIVCDGWSINIVVNELAACYSARVAGSQAQLSRPISFIQYALAEHQRQGTNTQTESYWINQFSQLPLLPELPTDRARPKVRSFGGDTCTAFIDADLYLAIKKASARQGCTLFSALFAALQVLVARLSGQNDVVVAVPAAGQSLLGDKNLVGHCVNLLPLRVPLEPSAPFSEHLKLVKRRVLDAYEHQDFTFGTLVRKLGVARNPARLPLTEIQFNLERIDDSSQFSGLSASVAPNPKAFSNFDLFVNVVESDRGLRLDCDFNTDVFDRTTIDRWIGHYRTLLAAIAENPARRIDNLPLLSPTERRWLVSELNHTAAEFPRNAMLHELIAAQAQRTPTAVAVADDTRQVTYAEFEALSNRLARRLLLEAPRPGARVAVAVTRSVEMLAAMVAVTKAGHAYVPLDPQYPPVRLRQILDDAGPRAFICDNATVAAIAPSSASVIRIDLDGADIAAQDPGPIPTTPGDSERAAYVIYTSGSAGQPKGVEVSHRALVNLLFSMAKTPGFTAKDTMLSVTTISFDIAGLELFLPLIVGGNVVIAPLDEVRDGFGLVERIRRSHASVLQATPSLWRILLEAGYRPGPDLKMLCGGEPLPRDLADQLLIGGGELWNLYGPTETTIWSSASRVANDGPIHIGVPIANTQLYVLDNNDELAPIGVPANLFIGGAGLANGYVNNPGLTANAFRDIAVDGAAPARRLYRTGDLAFRRPNGDIQLIGRADHQVKLRGFRIELEEIEGVLRRARGVVDCAVAMREVGGEQALVGYTVPQAGSDVTSERLAAYVAAHLPEYMTPTAWVTLEALPLTPNRKLDRKSLPDPKAGARGHSQRVIVAPRTPLEHTLAGIWRDVLKVGEIGVHDNLFALGGSSLHIFRIAARMMDANLNLQGKHLLHNPTIAQLADLLDSKVAGAPSAKSSALPSLRDFRGGARRGKLKT